MIWFHSALTALSCLAVVNAQNAANDNGVPTVEEIAKIINQTGLVPADVAGIAATFLAGIANSTRIQLDSALADNPVAEKRDNPELYYAYGRSPPVYPSRTYWSLSLSTYLPTYVYASTIFCFDEKRT